MMKRTILSLVSMVFIAAMTLTSCEEMMSAIDNPVGSYVQFPSTELTLQIGEDRPFQATTISPAKITYKSSDESVVTIDPQGFVTGIAFGEATITASVPATEYYAAGEATCKVKVASVLENALKEGAILSFELNVDGVDESVSFKKVGDNFVIENPMASAPRRAAAIITSYSLVYYPAKYELEFKVKQTDGTNTAYPLTVIFNLSKNTIQVIPGSPLSNVLFINVKLNGVIITGMLTKKEVAPTSVVIKGAPTTPFEMNVGGGDVTLTAVVTPADASDKKVTWSSSAPAVATVDETGKVHAVAVGTTTIKATTANGKEASIELTVNLPKATVTTAPTAKTGVKPGENAAIINAGVASGGTMMYAVTTTNTKPTPTSTFLFGSKVPTAQNLAAGTYYVWYYVKADATHADSDIAGSVSVTIQSAAASASESFTTTCSTMTKGGTSFDGTHFTVTASRNTDSNGINIANLNSNQSSLTIAAKNGETITKVEFTCGEGKDQASLTSVTSGTINWSNGQTNGSIENVNATSVTMTNSYTAGWVAISSVKVYYTE